jgi:hypothetical protein
MKKLLLLISFSLSVYGNAQSCPGTIFTSGPNALGTGGTFNTSVQNCLTYNVDLNTVLWIQRASPYWDFSGHTSGSIQTTWLNIGTNTWDSMIIYRDSAGNYGARYPGGTIFNPTGNFNIANALMIGCGPVNATAGWIGAWYSSRKPSGLYHSVTSTQDDNSFCATGSAPFGNIAATNNNYGGPNADMQQVGNTILVGGSLCEENILPSDAMPFKGGIIGKAVYSGGNLVWSADSIIPNFRLGSLGYLNIGTPRIAFSPDGQTGYAVFIGRLATTYNNNADSTLSPVVYKTINGGTSWSAIPILSGFDWSVGHPEMLTNVGYLYPQRKGVRCMPYAQQGIDVTVDSLGILHLVSSVIAPLPNLYSSLDSIAAYTNNYNFDNRKHHAIIWDMMTDGTTWNTILVDSLKTSYMSQSTADSSYAANPWSQGTSITFLPQSARIQVSRSMTGGKIFYSWADSDSSITHSLYNTNPDIYMKSYDISNQLVTPTVNETSGNGQCYFYYLCDKSYYDNNIGGYVCPLVYTTDKKVTPPFLSTDTVNYHYLNCATFYISQYNTTASVYRTQGSAGIFAYSNNALIKVYPNPSNGTIFIESALLNQASGNVQITDVIGKEINRKTLNVNEGKAIIDMSDLNSGVYFVTISTNNSSCTQKIVLQR